MKIEVGKKYRTRSGRMAVVDTTSGSSETWPIEGEVLWPDGAAIGCSWTAEGRAGLDPSEDHDQDIVALLEEHATTYGAVLGEKCPRSLFDAGLDLRPGSFSYAGCSSPRDIAAMTAIEQVMRGLDSLHRESVIAWFCARYPTAMF